LDEFSGLPYEYLSQPLVNQPGEQWEYGINIDWAGQLVERASGLRLNDYFQKHIFEPMGLKNINMFPTESMKKDLAYMHARTPGKPEEVPACLLPAPSPHPVHLLPR
jgi:CubicO group peptidase (beta-lactamase class C family)